MTAGQLADECLGESREGVVDRVADVSMIDVHAVRGRDELDDLSRVERPVHLGDRCLPWDPVFDDRVRDLAKRGPDRADPIQMTRRSTGVGLALLADPVGALEVHQAALREPSESDAKGREVLDGETIVVVEGVQEVEGGFDADVVGVAPIDRQRRWNECHGVTTLDLLTGYAQAGTLCVTGKDFCIGYIAAARRPHMEAIALVLSLFAGVLVIDIAAVIWGVDSRESMLDDRRR